MARKRTLNRMDFRGDFEGEEGEAKPADEEETDEEEEGEEEEEAEAEGDAEPDEEAGDDEDAPKPVKKPKKKAAAAPKRTRAPKIVRKKAIWVVYDNSSKEIETFEFSQRGDADAFLEQKNTDKKGAFYLQLVKIPFEDKEKEVEAKKK